MFKLERQRFVIQRESRDTSSKYLIAVNGNEFFPPINCESLVRVKKKKNLLNYF